MKLSDAINLGSSLIKPLAGQFLNEASDSGCAFGMAYVASGRGALVCQNAWPWIENVFRLPLPCGCNTSHKLMWGGCSYMDIPSPGLSNVIVHLFNYHVMTSKDWTLERLIDWVRSVEPAEPTLMVEAQAVEPEYATVT